MRPPTIAPSTCPAIAPIWNFCPLVACAVPCRSTTWLNLVRHDARHFAFGLGRLEHAAVEEHRPARQRERVDLLEVDDLEAVAERRLAELGRNVVDQLLAEPLDEVFDPLVVQQRICWRTSAAAC